MTVAELLSGYLADRDMHAKRPESIRDTCRPLLRHLGALELAAVDYPRLQAYREARSREPTQFGSPPSPSTLNRELTYLRAAWRRSWRLGASGSPPAFPMAPEAQPRQDFASTGQIDRLLTLLRPRHPDVADLVEFLAVTGWRRREALELPWSEVRWAEGRVVVPPARTKKARARVLPLVGPVLEILRRRQAMNGSAMVFHRGGRPIRYFRRSWRTATTAAGLDGLHVHGLRRSLARNHRLAGIPEIVTMALAGWEDIRSLRRYSVVNEPDIAAALIQAAAVRTSTAEAALEAIIRDAVRRALTAAGPGSGRSG